jgi:retron-type reverse transcriptase
MNPLVRGAEEVGEGTMPALQQAGRWELGRLRNTVAVSEIMVGNCRRQDTYYPLKLDAAHGVDGTPRQEHETGLADRLANLQARTHRGTYRAQPFKRAYRPKADGRQRPLDIVALEDNVVQPSCRVWSSGQSY